MVRTDIHFYGEIKNSNWLFDFGKSFAICGNGSLLDKETSASPLGKAIKSYPIKVFNDDTYNLDNLEFFVQTYFTKGK